jgi:hypothetical protein
LLFQASVTPWRIVPERMKALLEVFDRWQTILRVNGAGMVQVGDFLSHHADREGDQA